MGSGRRVLVMTHMFPHPEAPLSGPFILEQVRALRDQGHDVRVLCGRPFPMYLRRPFGVMSRCREFARRQADLCWDAVDGVPVVYAPFHVGWVARLLGRADPYRDAMLAAGRWLRQSFDAELIHAHTAFPDGHAALALARDLGKPFALTEHTGPFSTLVGDARYRQKTLDALAGASRVWCVSDALAREVRSWMSSAAQPRVTTLYNGVDTARFGISPAWRPNPARPRLLFVGLLEPVKNVPVLLQALAHLLRRVPAARLRIVGTGSQQAQIAQLARDLNLDKAVEMTGPASRDEVARTMRDWCDLLVLSSTCETFGVVLIEALSCGKPVVATRCGGPESIVTDATLGTLCAPDDARALADALEATVARLPSFDPRAIRAHAVQAFDVRQLARKLAEGYGEVLQASPAPRAQAG